MKLKAEEIDMLLSGCMECTAHELWKVADETRDERMSQNIREIGDAFGRTANAIMLDVGRRSTTDDVAG